MCSVARKKNLYFLNVDFVMIKQFLLEYTDLQFTIHEVLVLKTLSI